MSKLPLISIVAIVSLVLPCVLGYFHARISGLGKNSLLIYRYFALFNIVLAGLSIVVRVLMKHYLDPVYDMITAAILSMIFFTLVTLWRKDILMLAPALLWSFFVLLGAIFHIQELLHHVVDAWSILLVHILYDVFVATGLLVMFMVLKPSYGDIYKK